MSKEGITPSSSGAIEASRLASCKSADGMGHSHIPPGTAQAPGDASVTFIPVTQAIVCDGRPVGAWSFTTQGSLLLQIDTSMSGAQCADLLTLVSNFVQRKVWSKSKRRSTPKAASSPSRAQLDLFELGQALEAVSPCSTKEYT